MGRITKDIELKTTTTGKNVANFTIAVSRKMDKTKTDFLNCIAWQGTADFVNKYFKKGDMILVNGAVEVRSWDDSEGKKRYVTEILIDSAYFTGGKTDGVTPTTTAQKPAYTKPIASAPVVKPSIEEESDDLPF